MRILASLLSLLFLGALPVCADWVVLKSGQRIETKGAWEVKGRQVRFTTAKTRQLQALPVDEVDLDLSRTATGPDPNRPRAEAIAEGGPVTLGVDPDYRPPKPREVGLPRFVRDLAKEKLNSRTIEADKSLFGEGGTLSTGVSVTAQLYERSYHLRRLRAAAVAAVGEARVQELEVEFAGAEGEIYEICVDVGADPERNQQWYCYAEVLEIALSSLGNYQSAYNPEADRPLGNEPPPAAQESQPPPR